MTPGTGAGSFLILDTAMLDDLRDYLRFDNTTLWLLIGLCVATVITLQAVEEAVEGAWPHARRPSRMPARAPGFSGAWSLVALLVLPGLLLGILNVVVLLWKDRERTDLQVLGSLFVGLGWILFMIASRDRLPVRRFVGNLGVVGPVALVLVLLIGDVLLTIALFDVLPSLDEVRDALPIVSSSD